MKKNAFAFAALFIAIVAFALPLFAVDVDTSLSLETDFGFALPYTENPWKILSGGLTADAKLKVYGSDCTLFLDGSVTYDALSTYYNANSLNVVSFGVNTLRDMGLTFALKEAYFDYDGGFWGFRLGRQLVQWGAADSFIVSNVICPKNLTKLDGTDITDSMNAIDAVRLNFSADWFSADLYWIPFFTPATLPLAKSNILNSIFLPTSVDLTENGLGVLAINDFTSSSILLPEVKFANGEYGAKLSAYTSFADFNLYGYYGWEDKPIVRYGVETTPTTVTHPVYGQVSVNKPSGITLFGEYKRFSMVAFDSSIPAGPVTIRLEGACFPFRYFATSAESQMKEQFEQFQNEGKIDYTKITTCQQNHQLLALAGLDWNSGDWMVTAQYYADFVFGDTEKLDRGFFEHKTSLSVSYSALGGILDISISGIIGWNEFDSVIVPQIDYSLNDFIKLTLGAYFFQAGKGDGLYGTYKNLSSVLLKGVFYF